MMTTETMSAAGGAAFAEHANDEIGRGFIKDPIFFSLAERTLKNGWFRLVCWLPMGLVLWQAIRMRKLKRRSLSRERL